MEPPTFREKKSMLLLLFDAAKWRLMAASGKIALLSDERIAAATEAIARISDDIRDATIRLSAQDDAALHPSKATKDLEIQPAASAIQNSQRQTRRSARSILRKLHHQDPRYWPTVSCWKKNMVHWL
jgi:hypothetical protein